MMNTIPVTRSANATAQARRVQPGVAVALAVLLAACGADEPTVETDTVEVGEAVDTEFEADAIKDTTADVGIDTGPTAIEPSIAPEATAEALTDDVAEDASVAATQATAAVEDVAQDGMAAADDAWTSLQANWADSVDEVQAHFGELSEEDILGVDGDRERMVSVVQERYSLEPAEAEQQVADWEATL